MVLLLRRSLVSTRRGGGRIRVNGLPVSVSHPDNYSGDKNLRHPFLTNAKTRLALTTASILIAVFKLWAHVGDDAELDEPVRRKYGELLTRKLESGQAETLRWADGSIVQDYATRVGLPPQLVPTLTEYANEMGLWDIMMNKLYENPLQPGESDWYTFQSPYQKGAKEDEMRSFKWTFERPHKGWFSDAHWFNTADELAHEDSLRALAKGGFDEVLNGIGELYDLDELHVDGLGFMAMTHCDGEYLHTDFRHSDGGGYNVLFEAHSPYEGTPRPDIVVKGDNGLLGELIYSKDVGVTTGDGTIHATTICDHRAHRGVRITVTVFLHDLNEDNLDALSASTSSTWPPGKYEAAWMWAQRGRHWRKDGGPGLLLDRGRTAGRVKDSVDGCTEEDCEEERERNLCMKTCKVFLEDDGEFKLGVERREIFGY